MTHPHHAYACCTHNIAVIILIINEVVEMYGERDNKRVLKGVTMELGLASGELTRGTFDGLGMRTGSAWQKNGDEINCQSRAIEW